MNEPAFLYKDLTGSILGAALEVHKNLGHGFLENVYQGALALEMDLRKIPYQQQKTLPIFYKGKKIKEFVCDFLVDQKVLLELKALKTISNTEEAQVLNYLKAANLQVGLLINFGEPSLKFKRFAL
jgi:GxxExxY protein